MSFVKIGFSSFRNLEDTEMDVSASRVFLVGENGQGKTNFLEALYYLCYGSSFRGAVDSLIPRDNSQGFGLRASWKREGSAMDGDRLSEYGDIEEEISVKVNGKLKEIRQNGKILRDRKELVEHNPAVVFCHEDFGFASGEPERRRFFFDQCAGMISVSYIDILRSYKRVLKQRNAALKDLASGERFVDGPGDVIDALDPQFIFYGMELMKRRRALAMRFEALFPELFEKVSLLGRKVSLEYKTNWPAESGIEETERFIRGKRESELVFGTTRSGPHRDVWRFMDGNEDFTEKASTGELRLVSLVMRLVQILIYEESFGMSFGDSSRSRWPILLFDDVLLELDVPKRMRFLELLPSTKSGAQAFFTFLPEEPWTEYVDGTTLVYGVKNGRFENKTSFAAIGNVL
jgi:DNA replication and repair protein RecF